MYFTEHQARAYRGNVSHVQTLYANDQIRWVIHKLYAEIEVTVGVYWVAQKHHVYVIVTMNGLSAA